MNKTILIIEDEIRIRFLLKDYLLNEGFSVIEACDGEEGLMAFKNNNVDLILLDIMMPKMDGFACLEEIRKTKDIPVIMLSAMKEETDKLNSFNLGVDDYVTKPFSPKELIARVKAHLKRTVNNEEVYTYKDLIVDYRGRKVTINGKSVSLTPKEYELLTYFIKNKGIALSREQLLNSVWDYDYYGDDRTVDTHIKMLRKNLGVYRDLIKTVREVGYKYETEE